MTNMVSTFTKLRNEQGQPTDEWGVRIERPTPEMVQGAIVPELLIARRNGEQTAQRVQILRVKNFDGVEVAFGRILRDENPVSVPAAVSRVCERCGAELAAQPPVGRPAAPVATVPAAAPVAPAPVQAAPATPAPVVQAPAAPVVTAPVAVPAAPVAPAAPAPVPVAPPEQTNPAAPSVVPPAGPPF